ncbi:hypothetical protein M2101_001266 [Parabacteroides sp. PM5-20]|nr:hypothetical protein [Parabacteroides sp. PM5-20]
MPFKTFDITTYGIFVWWENVFYDMFVLNRVKNGH